MLKPHIPLHKHIIYLFAHVKMIMGVKFTKDLLPQFSSIGNYTYGLPTIHSLLETSKISIGRYCSFANNVNIFLDGEHDLSNVSTYPFSYFFPENTSFDSLSHTKSKGPVIIEDNVWVGFGCTILSGVTIAHGAVIAAGAVVTKDVKPFEVVGGVPARHIRFRFNKREIAQLMKTKWWLEEPTMVAKIISKLKQ